MSKAFATNTKMFKYLLILCLAVAAIQAVPVENEESDLIAEAIVTVLQRILDSLERLDLPVIVDVAVGIPLNIIKSVIEGILAASEDNQSLACLVDSVEEIGVETVAITVEEFENLLDILIDRQVQLEACKELPIALRPACRTRVEVATSLRVTIAVAKVTNAIEDIPKDVLNKTIDCILGLISLKA